MGLEQTTLTLHFNAAGNTSSDTGKGYEHLGLKGLLSGIDVHDGGGLVLGRLGGGLGVHGLEAGGLVFNIGGAA